MSQSWKIFPITSLTTSEYEWGRLAKKNFTSWRSSEAGGRCRKWKIGQPLPRSERFSKIYLAPQAVTQQLLPERGWGRSSGHSRRRRRARGVVEQFEDGADVEKGPRSEVDFEEISKSANNLLKLLTNVADAGQNIQQFKPTELSKENLTRMLKWLSAIILKFVFVVRKG